MLGALSSRTFTEEAEKQGLTDPSEIEKMSEFWKAWWKRPDAFYAKPNGEAVGWKE